MILDLFMIALAIGGFFAGWWCRGRFGTAEAMVDAASAKVKGWLHRAPPPAPTPAPTNKRDEF